LDKEKAAHRAVFSFEPGTFAEVVSMRKMIPLAILALLLLAGGFWFGRQSAHADRTQAASPAQAEASATTAGDEGAASAADLTTNAPAAPAGSPMTTMPEPATAENGSTALASGPIPAGSSPPPTERQLLDSRGLRADIAQLAVDHAHFDQLVAALAHSADADSLELTRLYHDRVTRMLAVDPRFRVDNIACSTRLCAAIASAPAGLETTLDAAYQVHDQGPRFYAIINGSVPKPGDPANAEYHLLFTIDPKLNAFTVGDVPAPSAH
jgi:hypothetical protein